MSEYYCDECSDKLESGSVYTDELRNHFCSEYCAMKYHGIKETDDWPGNDDADEQEKETRENYYLATYAKFGCITNKRYLIWGIETPGEIPRRLHRHRGRLRTDAHADHDDKFRNARSMQRGDSPRVLRHTRNGCM